MDVRVPVKLCSESMNNTKNSRFYLVLLFEEIHDSLSCYFWKKSKSTTMSSEESTEFFWNSKSEMKVVQVIRSPRDKISKSKIRSWSSTRIAETILTRECYLFDAIAIFAFETSKSVFWIST